MEKLFSELCTIINEVHRQNYSTNTIHKVFFRLKDVIPLSHAVLVVKNLSTDTLVIKNRYEVSKSFCNTYNRPVGTGVIGRIMYKDEIIFVDKTSSPEDYKDMYLERDYNCVVVLRIVDRNCPRGFMALYFDTPYEITDDVKEFLFALSYLCSESISKETVNNYLNQLRRVDIETELLYCNFFHFKLNEEFNKSKRHRIPLTLVLMDMDNYKEVLNLYGTDTAKELFTEISDVLKGSIRAIDFIGRYGTDEFIVCLPSTTLDDANVVINRFVERISSKKFTDEKLTTSLSIGMSCLNEGQTLEDLMKNVQSALYNAKVSGKGLVRIVS